MSTKKENAAIVGVGVAACAACCAGPILGFLAAIGLGTAVGFTVFGSAALVIGAITVVVVLRRRRRRADACTTTSMAAALLAHHAGDRVVVRSAGTAPADTINPVVVEAMAEIGIDLLAKPR